MTAKVGTMHGGAADHGGDDQASGLLDVSEVPLSELLATTDTVLAHAIRRLVDELADTQDVIAAFSSYAD